MASSSSSSFSYSIPFAGLPDIKVTKFNGFRLIRIQKFDRQLERGWDLYHHRCCFVHKLRTRDVCLRRNNSRQLMQAFGGLMAAAAASSSSAINSWNHDVFLSFRGPDTRNSFTGHLYQALREKGVNVFIDNELQRGEVITSELLGVIEGSRISIVVLSENFSSSSFCLDEAVKIHECKESKGQIVLPVFYHVDPTDVEEQTGTFGKELAKLEAQLKLNYWKVVLLAKAANICRYVLTNVRGMWPIFDELDDQSNHNNEGASTNIDRLHKWRLALTEVATLSGWHFKKGDHEATTIQSVVKMVLKQLDRTPLHVAEHSVGLDSCVNHILKELNLESHDVRMLGLHGMGGIGKTTTAKAIYNSCASQFGFDGSCFLLNVRENSKKYDLSKLQETLLFEILGDEKNLMGNFEKGIQLIKERLGCKKVVIVIDDVDHIEQLDKLVGGLKWFGAGSRIIITTRDSHLLKLHGVTTVHEIKELGDVEAMELFSWHAFKEPQPSEAYIELSSCVVRYAKGLPLALKVLGSSLFGRDVPMWEDVLKKLKQCPNDKITDVLKVSYDGLDSEEKAIFLDIACFFKGNNKDEVIECLDACGFRANFGLQRLIEKSLVYVNWGERVEMHDLLQEMGIQIAHVESSRLCIRKPEDIRLVLENKRPNDIQGVLLDIYGEEEVPLDMLKELTKLRLLIIRNGLFTRMPESLPDNIRWLEWRRCSLKSISHGFLSANLSVLQMRWCEIVHFEKAFMVESKAKKCMNLTRLRFLGCIYLREIGDFSAMPNLEELDLNWCEKLEKIDKSIGNLKNLECISLNNCESLVSLPNLEGNERLKRLDLRDCFELEKLPNLPATLEDLQVSGSGLKEIPSSIGNLTNISHLDVSYCKNLVSISSSIYQLPHLSTLHMKKCSKLTKFPEAESSMTSSSLFPRLKELNLSGTNIVTLPTCIFRFNRLERLILENCKWLVEIPELPRTVKLLNACGCKSLERFPHFHNNFAGYFTNCRILAKNEKERWRQVIFENLSLASIQGDRRGSSIILPGDEIPKWFDHAIDIEGNVSSFCFKVPPPVINGNFIGVTCCVIFQGNQVLSFADYDISIELHINGCYWCEISLISELESEHMWLSINKLDGILREMLEAGEVSCEFKWESPQEEIVYKRVGVHFM